MAKLSDAEILSNVLEATGSNANRLANKLGYKSASSIYHILSGDNKITLDMADKIVELYPHVNHSYLIRGEEPILLDLSKTQGQENYFGGSQYSFDEIPKQLAEIKDLLKKVLDKME